jgi:hypothetical protein
MTTANSRTARLLSDFGTPARPRVAAEEALYPELQGWAHAEVLLPTKPSFVVLSVKRSPFEWWGPHVLPPDVGLVRSPFPADPSGSRLLNKILPPGVPVAFVGDLDPPSIIQYVATRDRLLPTLRSRLFFGGVDSTWLDDVESALKPEFTFGGTCIALSRAEKRLLRRLEDSIDVNSLVGSRAAAMLRSGVKLEIEGATNPRLFRNSQTPWVFERLRERAEEARAGKRRP